MSLGWLDLPAAAVATVLLFSGLPKFADPRPIAATMESLRVQIARRWGHRGGSSVDLSRLGRLLGLVEVVAATWVVLGPSWASATALVMLAAGFAAAGLIGASTSLRVACACFGKQGRPLGYFHALMFPVWAGVAWTVARNGGLKSLDERLLVLAACTACVSCVYALKMWATVVPLARERWLAATRAGKVPRVDHR